MTDDVVQHDRQFSIDLPDGSRAFCDCFGGGDYIIAVRGKEIRFEWSERFGPLPVSKTGIPLELSWRHPFWRAASLWRLQGQRVDGNRCIWHEPKKPVLKHLGGKNYLIVENGEEGWDW